MTLEWLLIVAAIAGLAASSVLAVQQVVDDSTDLPARPDVRVIDAEIAAAAVAYEATQALQATPDNILGLTPQQVLDFDQRCQDVATSFDNVVSYEDWESPSREVGDPAVTLAKCVLDRR